MTEWMRAQASDLRPGVAFRSAIEGTRFSGKNPVVVAEMGPSRSDPSKLRLVVERKGLRHILVCEPSQPVLVDRRSLCECRNHMGSRKNGYATRDQAVKAIVKRHLAFGAHRVYKCPRSGLFHVTSRA